MSKTLPDRRESWGIRRDLNDLFRNERGKLSGSTLGRYAAQGIAGYWLLHVTVLPSWDVLSVLFLVLIAPEAYKQLLAMKWGGNAPSRTERTEHTEREVTTKTNVAVPAKGMA